MPAWISITEEDLNATKMAPLMRSLRTAAIAVGQSDPVVEITATVVERIRRKIAACRTNQVDTDTATIPTSLKSLACRMIVREAKDRLELDLSDTEKEAWRVDERELDKIASCDLPIETPGTAVAPSVQATQPGPSISGRRKQFSRHQQEGA